MIDEAHSLGVVGPTGRGIGEHFGVEREDVDLWMGTLSKALGACGGYIAGSSALVRYLRFTTPLFIFATGITPGDAAAARGAIRVLSAEPERVRRLQHLARTFVAGARERGLETGVAGPSAIVPIILGDWHRTISASNTLHERGINAMPIGHPAVAADKCRLRFFINVEHTEAQLRSALDAVVEVTGTPRPSAAPTQKGPDKMVQIHKTTSPDVLVAGATGFIGSRLTEMLVDKGARVRVLVRPGTDRRRLAPLDVELVEGSLEDTASLRRAVDGIRTIYNCTGLSTDWARWSAFEQTNVTGVKNLLEAAASAGSAERFLHLSTTDVYGYPVKACDESVEPRDVGLPYNRSKLLGEQAVLDCHKQTGLPVTIVRPVTVYGPRSKDWVIEIGKLLRTGKMMFVDGGSSCAGFLYIDNAVDGIIAAATSPRTNGLVYNLRDGSNETWREYVDALAAGMKAKPVKKSISSRLALGIARASEAVYGGLRVRSRPLLTRHAVYLMSRDQGYGIDRARQDLSFTPSVDFDAGMAATLRWVESDEGRASIPS